MTEGDYLNLFLCSGVEAEKAVNVFYYLTYEGRVDLNYIQDHVMREVNVDTILRHFPRLVLLTNCHDFLDKHMYAKMFTNNIIITKLIYVIMCKILRKLDLCYHRY